MTIVIKDYSSPNAWHLSLLGTIPNKTKAGAPPRSRDPCFSLLFVGFSVLSSQFSVLSS